MSIRFRTLASGALSYLPGAMGLYRRAFFRPNPASAEGSYGIWLKHLVFTRAHRARAVPRIVVEVGPGHSLGAGLAALICGAQHYVALDVIPFAGMDSVLSTFDRLVELFSARARPVNAGGFPPYAHALDAAGFPHQTLEREHLQAMLDPARMTSLRADLEHFIAQGGRSSRHVSYLAPWQLGDVPYRGEADFVFSHTVLQYVDSIDDMWRAMGQMLCRGGVCSHQISFDSQGISRQWNGHWSYPEPLWRIALGRKRFLLNREPLSRHVRAAQSNALQVVEKLQNRDTSGITRGALAAKWRDLGDDDLTTRGVLLVAQKD